MSNQGLLWPVVYAGGNGWSYACWVSNPQAQGLRGIPSTKKTRLQPGGMISQVHCELHSPALCQVLLCNEGPSPPSLETPSPERDLDTGIRISQDGILCSYEEGGWGLDTGIRVSQGGIVCCCEEEDWRWMFIVKVNAVKVTVQKEAAESDQGTVHMPKRTPWRRLKEAKKAWSNILTVLFSRRWDGRWMFLLIPSLSCFMYNFVIKTTRADSSSEWLLPIKSAQTPK